MSKQHTLYWMILAVGFLVILWAARKTFVRSHELSARAQQREQEFVTQFPEFAAAPEVVRRRRR